MRSIVYGFKEQRGDTGLNVDLVGEDTGLNVDLLCGCVVEEWHSPFVTPQQSGGEEMSDGE